MAISLNNVNSEVVRAHKRIDDFIKPVMLYQADSADSGVKSFTVPQQYRNYKFFLVAAFFHKSSLYDGIQTHVMCNDLNNGHHQLYGSYEHNGVVGAYNSLEMKSYTIKPESSMTPMDDYGIITVIAIV